MAVGSALRQDDIGFQAGLYSDPNPTRRGLHLGRKTWIEQQLDANLDADSRTLEVGVGCGVFTRMLAQRSASVAAIDINQKFLDGLADVARVETCNLDATIPFADRQFDLALCSEVIEHVPPERSVAMLEALHRALRAGGILILSTPQRFSTVEIFARALRFGPFLWLARKLYGHAEELGHINLLTRSALQRQIAEAGFEIRQHELLGLYLPIVAEFGGRPGWNLLRALEKGARSIPIVRNLLWTQAYVLIKR